MSVKKYSFLYFFHLYPKRLSHFRAVLERIPARQSIFPSYCTVLPLKIDYSSPSGISSSSGASLGQFVRRYPLTNKAKEYEVISIILLT